MMSGSQLGVVVAVFGILLTAFWFGFSQRRRAETELGIQSLANMKWRDCIAVVLEALHREGYQQAADSSVSGDGGSEFLLTRGNEKVLLGYKHGTAYRLTDSNVREFVNALHLRGARSGILLTLGSVETSAYQTAITHSVQLLEGTAVWPKVRPFLQPALLLQVRKQAAARTRKGLWMGAVGSVLLGLAIHFGSQLLSEPESLEPVAATAPAATAPTGAAPPVAGAPRSDAALVKQLNETARAMAEVAKLTPEQRALRRAEAAKSVRSIAHVDAAAWSAQSTLLVTLGETDGKDKALLEETCRILTQYEEMRFTRVQLQPPEGSEFPVRWRLCE